MEPRRWLRKPPWGPSVGTFRGALTSTLRPQFLEGWIELGPWPKGCQGLRAGGSPNLRLHVQVALGRDPPLSRLVADSALLLFVAMPMLTVGGILFLMTNLQVRAALLPGPGQEAGEGAGG